MEPRQRRRRRRVRWPVVLIAGAVLLAFLAYGVGGPWWRFAARPPASPPFAVPGGELVEDLRARLLEAVTVLWLLFFGASIGSFLNVLVYRVPRGKTLLGSSYCPFCRHPIRARHNVPVLGYFLLGGRCYDCHLPISPRYPVVEAVVGAIFLSLALLELFSGGANLPVRPPNTYAGIAWVIFDPQWDLIGIYLLHCGLLCILLTWTLIWYDGQRVPAPFALFALALVLILVAREPRLHPVPASLTLGSHARKIPHWVGMTDGLAGAFFGCLLGTLVAAPWSRRGLAVPASVEHPATGRAPPPGDMTVSRSALQFSLVGASLGWQAALSVGWLATALMLGQTWRGAAQRKRLLQGWPVLIFFATWLQLGLWRLLYAVPGWPRAGGGWYLVPIQVVVCTLLAGHAERRNRVARFRERPTTGNSKF